MNAETALPWHNEYLIEHFQRITVLLRRYQALWRPQAFQYPRLPWESQFPELAQMLRSLDVERAEQLAECDLELMHQLEAFVPDAAALYTGCQLPALAATHTLPDLFEARAVPGRKWRQIKAFSTCVPCAAAPLVEWCSGKAHLGRLLARTQQRSVAGLEWNAALVESGTALAQREKLPIHLYCADVLQASSKKFIQRECDVIALHACGELHMQLLRVCGEQQPQTITLAPCCYHLVASATCEPLSAVALQTELPLSLADLHTAVRDSVTSPQRIQRQRKTLQAWRLGFDLWQREVRGIDTYLATPSQPLSVLSEGFAKFFRDLALSQGMEAPIDTRYEYYEQAGWRRLREVVALDLPRILFRRALELWLILDRALYLREHGYQVEVGIFCERQLTPRNIAIRAHRRADS
ncbi:MAG TPA: methyltransferase [Spongiibacteraceae bacterium]|nr:methyltransferase [Spongiibacteraceae bacterium]